MVHKSPLQSPPMEIHIKGMKVVTDLCRHYLRDSYREFPPPDLSNLPGNKFANMPQVPLDSLLDSTCMPVTSFPQFNRLRTFCSQ